MNPLLLKSFTGAAVRWLMALAGAHGVNLGSEDANTIINALLILIPILWSILQKWITHEEMESAKLAAELSQRRG